MNIMKFQFLAVALLLVPCFVVRAVEEAAVVEDDACACECLAMHTPTINKVAQRCSVQEYAPTHCFQVEKFVKTIDYYKIDNHSRSCCTVTDENGTRPCGCNEVVCSTIEKCGAPKCCKQRCEATSCRKCHESPCKCAPRCRREKCCR